MKLDQLKPLYRLMKVEEMNQTRFYYTFNEVKFDVFFFIDVLPFRLMFGALGYNFFFEIDVEEGFNINPFLSRDKYTTLVTTVLKLKYDPNYKFEMSKFFVDFNRHIPQNKKNTHKVLPQDIAKHRADIEECEKIYFCGWLDNDLRGNKRSSENLKKSKTLLPNETFLSIKDRNISSKWTDLREKAIEVHSPC